VQHHHEAEEMKLALNFPQAIILDETPNNPDFSSTRSRPSSISSVPGMRPYLTIASAYINPGGIEYVLWVFLVTPSVSDQKTFVMVPVVCTVRVNPDASIEKRILFPFSSTLYSPFAPVVNADFSDLKDWFRNEEAIAVQYFKTSDVGEINDMSVTSTVELDNSSTYLHTPSLSNSIMITMEGSSGQLTPSPN